ncbi:rap guanine nucleotide exchange factor 6 isoform X1, partial [Tachysurus ichikawai]
MLWILHLCPAGYSSTQVMKKTSVLVEQYSGKENDDLSSLHSSPTMSPQGSPVGVTELPGCSQLNFPVSLPSLANQAKIRKMPVENNVIGNLNNLDPTLNEILAHSSTIRSSPDCMQKARSQIQSASLHIGSENYQSCT